MRHINAAGLQLLKKSEACRLTAYKDCVGVVTVGWGHTGIGCHLGQTITQEDADEILRQDLAEYERAVEEAVKVEITDNQFSGLVDLAYNIGVERLKHSTLLVLLNEGKHQEAAEQFAKWAMAGGHVQNGLVKRRAAERALFLTP